MTRRRGLGKGLDALIPPDEPERKAGVQEVPIDGIPPTPRQPRTQIDPEALRELAESIREHGILQPLIVSPEPFGGGYALVAGARRLEAGRPRGRGGKSRTPITNPLRLLRLTTAARQALTEGAISEGHARALLSLPSAQAQSAVLQTLLNRGLNVRQTEEVVRRLAGDRKAPSGRRSRPPQESDPAGQPRPGR